MRKSLIGFALCLMSVGTSLACSSKSSDGAAGPLPGDRGLRSVGDFDEIDDPGARSVALFQEVGKVLKHPRCINCHPTGERPTQGEGAEPHQPLVVRGEYGFGAPGLACNSCHGAGNYQNVPGNPVWRLAPASMAWAGSSLGEICLQFKDPERNGGRSLEAIASHFAQDGLVAYGWDPPKHLERAPGNQRLLAELVQAWIETGAHCPKQ